MSEILMNCSLWQSGRAELCSHTMRHWVNSVIWKEYIQMTERHTYIIQQLLETTTSSTVQCLYIRTQCNAFIYVHSAMPLYTYTVQCLYIRTQCNAFIYVHSAMPLYTYTVQCLYIRTQCNAFIYVHSAMPLYTYTVQCFYIRTQCNAFIYVHSAMPLSVP